MPSTFAVWDREIPIRSSIDFDYARDQLTTTTTTNRWNVSSSSSYYTRLLSALLNINNGRGSRILAFNNRRPAPKESLFDFKPPPKPKLVRPDGEQDAPGLIDDFYLNLLDWGASDVVALALESSVYLLSVSETSSFKRDGATVASVGWDPYGRRIAVGLENSDVQLWDPAYARILTTLRGVHGGSVGSLAWSNGNVLTTGGEDGCVIDNDVRVPSHVVCTYKGHNGRICGLKWSDVGQLASGGNDNLVCIWDRRNPDQWVHRLTDHIAGVRALAWCPFKDKLLATGGGQADGCIRFWNTQSGACMESVRVGSQVCALMWSKNSQELLSSCGFGRDNLTLWAYPEMVRTGQLVGHTNRVLYVARSPDGCSIATASGGQEEAFRLWRNVFPREAAACGAFGDSNRVLIRLIILIKKPKIVLLSTVLGKKKGKRRQRCKIEGEGCRLACLLDLAGDYCIRVGKTFEKIEQEAEECVGIGIYDTKRWAHLIFLAIKFEDEALSKASQGGV